jgi:methanogenic corrinoid protein MtbC1
MDEAELFESLRKAVIEYDDNVARKLSNEAVDKTIGADGYGRDMLEAVAKAKSLVGAS